MKDETDNRQAINVPQKVAQEIHMRCINALRVNTLHASKLHEQGGDYAVTSHLDNALGAWLLTQMKLHGATPRESIECGMELIIEHLLPAWLNLPVVKAAAIEEMKTVKQHEEETGESNILAQINALLKDSDIEPILVGGTLEEIIEQLQGLLDSEKATVQ
jgi:hypothetical protein